MTGVIVPRDEQPDDPGTITTPEGVIRQIMAMHWDMAACQCWVCVSGRSFGLAPRDDYLDWRGRRVIVTVPTMGDPVDYDVEVHAVHVDGDTWQYVSRERPCTAVHPHRRRRCDRALGHAGDHSFTAPLTVTWNEQGST